jgi:hypothetical protein
MLYQMGLSVGKNGGHFCNTNCRQLKSVTTVELEQRHIIKSLHLKGLKLQEIAAELSSAYGKDARAWWNIKYWLRQVKLGRSDLQTQYVPGRPPLDDADAEILLLLRNFLFSPVRTIVDSLLLHYIEQLHHD